MTPADFDCNCPRCAAGEDAPHEYHLESRRKKTPPTSAVLDGEAPAVVPAGDAGWQPMASSPKDGSKFLAMTAHGHVRLVHWSDPGGDKYPIEPAPSREMWPTAPIYWRTLESVATAAPALPAVKEASQGEAATCWLPWNGGPDHYDQILLWFAEYPEAVLVNRDEDGRWIHHDGSNALKHWTPTHYAEIIEPAATPPTPAPAPATGGKGDNHG